ncbi:hypothetical protein AN958_04015 [Leucoagaricus sp. SymC.cos]|nr:hypothetical protein AN958_04015 [Leucoagaricus sp. SymC.cos]
MLASGTFSPPRLMPKTSRSAGQCKVSFEGATDFSITGGNFGPVRGNITTVNVNAASDASESLPQVLEHLPLGHSQSDGRQRAQVVSTAQNARHRQSSRSSVAHTPAATSHTSSALTSNQSDSGSEGVGPQRMTPMPRARVEGTPRNINTPLPPPAPRQTPRQLPVDNLPPLPNPWGELRGPAPNQAQQPVFAEPLDASTIHFTPNSSRRTDPGITPSPFYMVPMQSSPHMFGGVASSPSRSYNSHFVTSPPQPYLENQVGGFPNWYPHTQIPPTNLSSPGTYGVPYQHPYGGSGPQILYTSPQPPLYFHNRAPVVAHISSNIDPRSPQAVRHARVHGRPLPPIPESNQALRARDCFSLRPAGLDQRGQSESQQRPTHWHSSYLQPSVYPPQPPTPIFHSPSDSRRISCSTSVSRSPALSDAEDPAMRFTRLQTRIYPAQGNALGLSDEPANAVYYTPSPSSRPRSRIQGGHGWTHTNRASVFSGNE